MARNTAAFTPTDAISGTAPFLLCKTKNLEQSSSSSSDLNALKYTITAIREELSDNISVLVNCAGNADLHGKDIHRKQWIVHCLL
jgi:hypothetical protein